MSIEVTKRPYETVFSGNAVHYELFSAVAAADATNSIYFEVRIKFKQVGGAYETITTLPYYPSAGYASIDLKDILHSQLEYGLIPFNADEKAPWEAPNQTGFFYLEFREITTLNPDPSWNTTEADFERFVVKGGLNYFAYRGNNYWINYFDVNKPFFTWQKSNRLAAPAERMFLAWLNYTDVESGDLRLQLIAYYTDGTNSGAQTKIFSAIKNKVYYLPVGHDQWELADIDDTKTIWKWTAQVMDYSGTPEAVSELFSFRLDYQNDYNDITLHYRNSLGGLDSVRVRGVVQQDLQYNFTEQQSTFTPDYFNGESIQPQRKIGDNTEQEVFKGDIGHLGKEEQDRLRDAFIQREVWQAIESKWWPVIITTKTNKLRTSTDSRWTLPIEFELAYPGGEYYTPRSLMGELGDGSFTDNVCQAFAADVTVNADLTGSEAAITVDMTETDPQGASALIRYRVKKTDGTTIIDWTEVAYGSLAFELAKEFEYIIEIQSICTNNVYGKVITALIDTQTSTGGSGGGGGGGPVFGNSTIRNNTSTPSVMNFYVNESFVAGNYVGAGSTLQFTAADTGGTTNAELRLYNVSPGMVTLESNGVTYYGGAVSFVGGYWTLRFTDIIILDGVIITVY